MKSYLAIITALLLLIPNLVFAQEARLSGWITYSMPTGEGLIVVMYNLDTNEERLLTDPIFDGSGSIISPLGDQVAFLSNIDGKTNIYVINSDGTNLTQLTHSVQNVLEMSWSYDGSQIAYTQGSSGLGYVDIYRVNVDGISQPVLLTNSTYGNWRPSWSPSGNVITFTSNRDGSYDVYIMGSNGENVTQLTTDGNIGSMPQWSPDGSKIGYRGAGDDYYYMNPDGSNVTLIADGNIDTGNFYWLSNSQILFEQPESTLYRTFVAIDIDGTNRIEFDFNFPADFVNISQANITVSVNCHTSTRK